MSFMLDTRLIFVVVRFDDDMQLGVGVRLQDELSRRCTTRIQLDFLPVKIPVDICGSRDDDTLLERYGLSDWSLNRTDGSLHLLLGMARFLNVRSFACAHQSRLS